jgi:hypothetical protein
MSDTKSLANKEESIYKAEYFIVESPISNLASPDITKVEVR